jgi:hypothetical protein
MTEDILIKIGADIEVLRAKLAESRKLLRDGLAESGFEKVVAQQAIDLKKLQAQYKKAYNEPIYAAMQVQKQQDSYIKAQEKQRIAATKQTVNAALAGIAQETAYHKQNSKEQVNAALNGVRQETEFYKQQAKQKAVITKQQVNAALAGIKQETDFYKQQAKQQATVSKQQVNAALTAVRQQEEYVSGGKKAVQESLALGRAIHQNGVLTGQNKKLFDKNYESLKKQYGGALQKGFITKTQLINEAMKRTRTEMTAGKMQFQGWALSIMFAGQAVKNAMMQIWTSSQKTFQDVMHSTEGTVTGFDMLDGSMKYLGFTIGQALEPIAMWLVPIIDMVANWVSENEGLVRTLFVVLTVFGTIASIVGFAVLAVAGFVEAWALAGPAIAGAGQAVATFFGGAAATIGLPVIAVIALIAAAVMALVAMWKTNFGGIRDFVKETMEGLWITIKSIFGNIFGIFSGIWKVVKGVFTGDFDLLWEGIIDIIQNVRAVILKIFFGLGAAIMNVFIFIWNFVGDGFYNLVKIIIGAIRALIRTANLIPGVDISTASFDKAIADVQNAKLDARIGYISADSIAKDLGGIDAMLGLDKETAAPSVDNSTKINQVTVNVTGETDWQKLLDEIKKSSGAS